MNLLQQECLVADVNLLLALCVTDVATVSLLLKTPPFLLVTSKDLLLSLATLLNLFLCFHLCFGLFVRLVSFLFLCAQDRRKLHPVCAFLCISFLILSPLIFVPVFCLPESETKELMKGRHTLLTTVFPPPFLCVFA